ncbi:MAG: DUF58 domain-containing protein [Deltaproteobacteria bacterium]|nr:MAG: DUF58 domain-containing protein [Deltaproteobacteria bacterium]
MLETPSPRGPRLALSERGRLVGLTALTWTAVGLIASLPVVTALGLLPATLLIWGFVRARVARQRLEDRGLQLRLDPGAEIRTVTGRTVVLEARPRVTPGVDVHGLELEPGVTAPTHARVVPTDEDGVFEVHVASPRVGHAWIQGFQVKATVVGGLFEVRVWVATPVAVEVLPRHFPLRSDASLRATRASMQEHSDVAYRRRPGLGLEIRELRDFQAGDPFKHIAWSASARRGKLISREFESDLALSTWILVDCSPSMFWGRPGDARIDYAIETAYNLASVLIAKRDRAGLLVHDDKIRLVVKPGAGPGQLTRIVNALTEVPHLVHDDRTELTDRELVERVARWFTAQRRQSFALPAGLIQAGSPRLSHYDEARLIEAAQEVLQEVALEARRAPLIPFDGYAADYQRSVLRAFCRHVGIPLPVDPTLRPGGQARGLEAAVEAVMASRGGPHTMVSISDFFTADDVNALRRVAVAARRRHHSLLVLCPDHQGFDLADADPEDRLQHAIIDVERLRVRQNLTLAQTVLKPAGAVFLSVGPEDALARILARLRQVA